MNNWSQSFGIMLTTTVTALVVVQPAFAKTAKEVAQTAVPTTVQINNALGSGLGGSGVIIAKDGKTYTVLTAYHVVANPNTEYTIKTSRGNNHAVKSVKSLQTGENTPDLAVVIFESNEEYAIAPLSDSDEATIGSGVYISGYPLPGVGGTEREYAFTNGQVTNVRNSDPEGYTLRYDAVTRRGMSGGPVFDVSGRVVGIHGQGDTAGSLAVQKETGQGTEEIKTGLNSAIPINTFMQLMPAVGMEEKELKIDNEPPANVDAEVVDPEDVDNWFDDYADDLLEDVKNQIERGIRNQIDRGIRKVLPF
jgi:serine protease Do